MLPQWELCSSCRCHVRPGEPSCPHCGAGFEPVGSRQKPVRRRFAVRRLLCASALASAALPGCAGKTLNEDVQGTCDPSPGANPSTHATATPGIVAAGCGTETCVCGTGGVCRMGACVSCECAVDETCNPDGTCTAIANYWFGQYLPTASTCYGSPPLLA
jgi:hypothetical protein